MSNLEKELGRVVEAISQGYQTHERMWAEFSTIRNDLKNVSVDLREVAQALKSVVEQVDTLQSSTTLTDRAMVRLQAEVDVSKRWIRGIITIIIAVIPLSYAQLESKTKQLTTLEQRLMVLEWTINKEDYYVKQSRNPKQHIPTPVSKD